jgi:hypothetical protein
VSISGNEAKISLRVYPNAGGMKWWALLMGYYG